MNDTADRLKQSVLSVKANADFTEAVMQFRDDSVLCFHHSVDERWAKAFGENEREDETGIAGQLLSGITIFRLNSKHLDIQFQDGSSWDEPIGSQEAE